MRVCLISAYHLWVNPRLVKEADALAEQGHRVHVLTCSKDAWSDQRDKDLLQRKIWKPYRLNLVRNNFPGFFIWLYTALRQKFFFMLSEVFPQKIRFAEEAYFRGYPFILRRAIQSGADLYIAHTQAAIPIAARAASYNRKPFGFDCEDLNAEAEADGKSHPQIGKNIRLIERTYLKMAAYVATTSRPMARFLTECYGIKEQMVIYNVFSNSELLGISEPIQRAHSIKLRLVWMSATIGRGRGLEMVLRSMNRIFNICELHLYGRFLDERSRDCLISLVKGEAASCVFIHPMPQPMDVMKTVAMHDVGLALDDGSCLNLSLTICNKFFLYVQAGLVVAATRLAGQQSIFEEQPDIGFMIYPDDEGAFCTEIMDLARNRNRLILTKQAAWEAGARRYNWELYKKEFLRTIGQVCQENDEMSCDRRIRVSSNQ